MLWHDTWVRGLDAGETTRVQAICDELMTVRIGRPPPIDDLLREARTLLDVEGMLLVSPREETVGYGVERLHAASMPRVAHVDRRFRAFFQSAPHRYAWYDATRPEPSQRNRVLEAIERIPPGEYEASRIYREVMVPLRLERHRQLRVLLCDGPSLLAWFGAFHASPVATRQYALLRALAPALRARLALERQLGPVPRLRAALDAALEEIAAPAFLTNAAGVPDSFNSAGHASLQRDRRGVCAALAEAVRSPARSQRFSVTALRTDAGACGHLVVAKSDASGQARAGAAARRWSLTKRQTEVLDWLARGATNVRIAAELRISERTVEVHVAAIFGRAEVSSRAELVAKIFGIDA